MENRLVGIVKAVCTQCGACLDVDSSKEATKCSFCGTPLLIVILIKLSPVIVFIYIVLAIGNGW